MKAKKVLCLCLCLLLPLFFAAFFTDTARADLTSDRAVACLDAYIANPWPDPSSSDPNVWGWGKAGRALASLYRNTNLLVANQDVNAVCNFQDPLPASGFDDTITMYFEIPMLCRMYLDTNCYSRLNNGARTNIQDMLWQFTKSRSKYWQATGKQWAISKSQNHEMAQKTTYMLACQLLKPIKGGSTTLNDNYTIDQHLAAWKKYFYEFFRQRAREGLNCEMAPVIYDKYTLGAWYNLRDFCEDPNLRNFASDFLNLYYADYASDFLPFAGNRAGGATRVYKDLIGSDDSVKDILYIYNWHDNVPDNMSPYSLIPLTSAHRNLVWLDIMAGNPNRTAYLNTTRRYGKGNWAMDANGLYQVVFDTDHASQIRRDTWWHRDYTMGTVTYKTDGTTYIDETNQNRALGVFYDSNGVVDRIIFDGNGTYDGDHRVGFTEVTGITGKNCIVASWDKNARSNNGVFLFVPNGALINNKSDSGNWIFTKTGPYGAVGRKFIADVCSVCVRNELLDGNNSTGWVTTHNPSIVNNGQSGKCLQFVAANKQIAFATQGWKSYDSVKADFWFNADTTQAGTRLLVNAPSTWEISVSNRDLTFLTYNNVGGGTRFLKVTNAFKTGTWSHVIASINASGRMDLTVDSNVCTPLTDPNVLKIQTKDIVLGNKPNTTRFFDGKIDTVRISVPSGRCIAAWDMEADYTKDVYTGIWIATGGYRTVTDTVAGGGKRWVLLTKTSPIIIQVAPSDNWPGSTSYADFQAAAIAKNPSYVGTTLTYTSLDNESFTYYANSNTLPLMGGSTVNLNPNETYKGPYVNGNHGMDAVTIQDGLGNSKTFNFNFICSPKWDDYQTVALWHMDSIASNQVADDDLEASTRNNHLNVYGTPNTNTNGPMSAFSKSLSFNGTTQYGQAVTNWPSYSTVKVDVWFDTTRTDANNQVIVAANNTWSLSVANGNLSFGKWRSGGTDTVPATGTIPVSTNTWYHCTATVDAAGAMSVILTPLNGTATTYTNAGSGAMLTQSATIQVGNKSGYGRWFKGYMDDIKIAKYSTP